MQNDRPAAHVVARHPARGGAPDHTACTLPAAANNRRDCARAHTHTQVRACVCGHMCAPSTVCSADPVPVAELCREDGVYLVPLKGGVRVALCATPQGQVERLVKTLASALERAS